MAFEFRLPDIGEGVAEGEVVKWHVQVGDSIQEDQVLVDIMTDKVTAEIPAPCAGVIQELRFNVGQTVPVGAVFVVIDRDGSGASPQKQVASTASAAENGAPPIHAKGAASTALLNPPPSPTPHKVLAAPATRKKAREMGLDLSQIQGSGPHGRILPDDLAAAPISAPALAGGSPNTPIKALPHQEGERRVPLAGLRRKIAEHLTHSKRTAPHFGYVDEVDMSEIVALRKALKAQAESENIQLTYLPFIIKAVIEGLRAFPMLNASLDDAKQEIVYKDYFNIGIAVATEEGLTVPVLRHANQYTLKNLAKALQDLSERARNGKLTLEDMRNGTFTVTSIGSVGGLFGLPIINHPEVAILGVNKISDRAVVRNGEIVIRPMMNLSISCDHRVVDGVDGARFVNHVKALLESPAQMLYNS